MSRRKHLLRGLYVLVLISLYVVVDRLGLPHFFNGGIIGGLGASAAAWLLSDRVDSVTGTATSIRHDQAGCHLSRSLVQG